MGLITVLIIIYLKKMDYNVSRVNIMYANVPLNGEV